MYSKTFIRFLKFRTFKTFQNIPTRFKKFQSVQNVQNVQNGWTIAWIAQVLRIFGRNRSGRRELVVRKSNKRTHAPAKQTRHSMFLKMFLFCQLTFACGCNRTKLRLAWEMVVEPMPPNAETIISKSNSLHTIYRRSIDRSIQSHEKWIKPNQTFIAVVVLVVIVVVVVVVVVVYSSSG